MPAIVVCAACQTKLKVPENSTAKALKCPKCKGIVAIAPAKADPETPPGPKSAPFEPKKQLAELNSAAAAVEQEEELEVNEPVDEEEELEVNEAVDEEEPSADEDEGEDKGAEEDDEDSALVGLGFATGKDPFKIAGIPEPARKAIEKALLKNEKALWAGRPSKEIIESKAWLGLVVGGVAIAVSLFVCVGTGLVGLIAPAPANIIAPIVGVLFALLAVAIGVAAIVFRKHVGGNVTACYVVGNKRAYIYDGRSGGVRAFTPEQLADISCDMNAKFDGAGDLIFAYDFMGDQGVQVSRHQIEALKSKGTAAGRGSSTKVGFLNIEQVQLVQRVLLELLIEPGLKKAKKKDKKLRKKGRRIF